MKRREPPEGLEDYKKQPSDRLTIGDSAPDFWRSALVSTVTSLGAAQAIVIFLRITHSIFRFMMTQPVHEAIDMAEILGVETRTGINSSLHSYGNRTHWLNWFDI